MISFAGLNKGQSHAAKTCFVICCILLYYADIRGGFDSIKKSCSRKPVFLRARSLNVAKFLDRSFAQGCHVAFQKI
jgi:hypothetical protein